MAKFKRILLKLSGESLMGEQRYGIDEKRLAEYAEQIKRSARHGRAKSASSSAVATYSAA